MTTLCYPVTRPLRSSEPTFDQEPLTEADARRQCGASEGYPPDSDFRDWIVNARRQVEHDAQMVFYTGSFVWRFTYFPYGDTIEIPCVRPVTAVAITYTDGAGATQTLSSSQYSLDSNGLTTMVKLNYGYVWPSTREDINGITMTLTAGYASVALMPAQYRAAVVLKVQSHYATAIGEDLRRVEQIEAAYDRQIALVGKDVVA
jgi:uncharacterized phiE125 gp8 family phage protein